MPRYAARARRALRARRRAAKYARVALGVRGGGERSRCAQEATRGAQCAQDAARRVAREACRRLHADIFFHAAAILITPVAAACYMLIS